MNRSHLKRTLGYAGAGLAGWRMRGGRDELVRQRAARHLCERLGRMRGLPQKVGQILSMSSDAGRQDAFAASRDSAVALPLSDVLPILAEEWGREPREVVTDIEVNGLAASIGQVHRATLVDGREVAVKVQYPGIREVLETDLRALGWIAAPMSNIRSGFDLDAYRDLLGASLDEELDYLAEARNQRDLAAAAGSSSLPLVVPRVVDDLTTARVLMTTWEDGDAFDAARSWSAEARADLARTLLDTFATLAFDHGLIHADPHPGNYRFRLGADGPQVVLFDHGCVHRVGRAGRLALLRTIAAASDGGRALDPFDDFVDLGFDPDLLRPLRAKLPALANVLFEPFATDGPFDLADWRLGERVQEVLGDDRMNFRIAGPAELMFFLRAFHGLKFYVRELGESVSWFAPFRAALERSRDAVIRTPPRCEPTPHQAVAGAAEHLCIHVTEAGETRVRVTMPANAVERLDDLVDPDVLARIAARGVDLDGIVDEARADGFPPHPLFDLEDGERRYAVWLE